MKDWKGYQINNFYFMGTDISVPYLFFEDWNLKATIEYYKYRKHF